MKQPAAMRGAESGGDLTRNRADSLGWQRSLGAKQFLEASARDHFGDHEWSSIFRVADRFYSNQVGMVKVAQQSRRSAKLPDCGLIAAKAGLEHAQAAELINVETSYPVCRGDFVRIGFGKNNVAMGDEFPGGPRQALVAWSLKPGTVLREIGRA